MKTFNFESDWGVKRTKKPRVKVISFGDGYEQRQQDGIHHTLRSYELTFSGDNNRINAIDTFLSECRGVEAFLWTPYQESAGKFKCEEWSTIVKTSHSTLTATFQEVIA